MSKLIYLDNAATTKDEIDYVVEELKQIIKTLRNMSPLYEDFVKRERVGVKA